MKPEEGLNMAALQSTKLLHEKVSMTHLIVTLVRVMVHTQSMPAAAAYFNILWALSVFAILVSYDIVFMKFWQYPYYCFLH